MIFVQKQFSVKQAESLAREIQGEVISIDPLSGDYFGNLLTIAQTFARTLQ